MRVFTLDVATDTGWASFDTREPYSSIECASISLSCAEKNSEGKTRLLWEKLPPLLIKHDPDIVFIETPSTYIFRYKNKKKDLTGKPAEDSMNAHTACQLNHLAGAAQMLVLGFELKCKFVAPKTWQSILPDSIRHEDVKKRVTMFCDLLKINGPNQDARDAAIMAVWAQCRSQELKLLERQKPKLELIVGGA